jgi:uncharacterized damage-inducible protein DinB
MEETGISHGSLRNLFVHIISVDERWFSGIRKVEDPGFLNPKDFLTQEGIREKWDHAEQQMGDALSNLTDEDLKQVFQANMKVWHVLAHVVNHGTHHRAQIGEMLRNYGLNLVPQDYIFFVMGRIH